MKKKPTYTHPELAKYVEKLIARHGGSGWKRLFYIIREETIKTVQELVANDKLIYAGALIEIPPPPVKNRIKKSRKYDTYSAIAKANKLAFQKLYGKNNTKEVKNKIKNKLANPAKPKRHEGG